MDFPVPRRNHKGGPEQEFAQLRDAFATQLEQWPDFFRSLRDSASGVTPLAEVEETDDSYLLVVELPGVRREDIDLQVDQGRVRLDAERRERERIGLLRHRTRTTGRFSLDVTLPGPVDSEGVHASLDHGLLTIVVPKAEQARRRRIQITSGR